MQDVNRTSEANGVDGAVGVATKVIHDLQNASAAKALQRLGIGRLETELRVLQRAANPPPDFLREVSQVLLAAADPAHRLGVSVASGRLRHVLEPL